MSDKQNLTMSIDEVCEALNLSRPIVMPFIHRRDNPLPCIKTGRRYRIPRASFEKWVEEEAERQSGGVSSKAR